MKKKPEFYLKHIIDECNYLIEKTNNLKYLDFIENQDLRRSFIRSLEIIGEASKNLPKDFKDLHSDIPWIDIVDMRNKLIHEYFGVDYKLVWETIQKEIPILKKKIDDILKNL